MGKELGVEYPSKNEAAWTKRIISALTHGLLKRYKKGETLRFFHPKMHGCLKGEFTVASDLPTELAVGLFSKPSTYTAIVRFSNASPKAKKSDRKKDFRGIAIKLLAVEGKKEMPGHANDLTHDFILVNKATFQAKNLRMIGMALEALNYGLWKKIVFVLNYLPELLKTLSASQHTSNLLEENYWSQVAHRFGSAHKACKYKLVPHQKPSGQGIGQHDDYLSERMASDLSKGSASFDFMVQFQLDADKMPIEDPSVVWDSPFYKVATLTLYKQGFQDPIRKAFGENLSYNPWRCLSAHIPLGSAGRVRKDVYAALSKIRHQQNDLPEKEPDQYAI